MKAGSNPCIWYITYIKIFVQLLKLLKFILIYLNNNMLIITCLMMKACLIHFQLHYIIFPTSKWILMWTKWSQKLGQASGFI